MTGKVIVPFIIFFLLVSALHVRAQDRGLTVIAAENLGSQANIGKQYALFIAIDAYRHWPALKKPVADAQEIRDILQRDYYIDEVIELYNQQATRANIARTFTELQTKLGVHDSLFIYYAGHGHLDESSAAGFWIPVDGGTDPFAQENWLPNAVIRGYISRFRTIHVFIVSDACFSGDILTATRSLPPRIDNAYYRRAYALTSRQVLTSGSSETVPDQSEFSAALINCLRKNTSPLLDPIGIYNNVRLSVRGTTPLYGTLNLANHQDGATFLFFRRTATQPVVQAQPPDTPPSASQPRPSPLPPPEPSQPPTPSPPPVENERAGDTDRTARFNSIGVSLGSTFAAPLVLGTLRGTVTPLRHSFLEIGLDIGGVITSKAFPDTADVSYFSLYPFVHYAFFLPINARNGWYLGGGAGFMFARYGFPAEAVWDYTYAVDIGTGFLLWNMIDISYTLRTNFRSVDNKIAVGFVKRFR